MDPSKNLPYEIIFRWDSEEVRGKMMFDGDREEAERYLEAVDEIQSSDDESGIVVAMARLEDEFRHILISHTNPTSSSPHLIYPKETEEDQIQRNCACFSHLRFNASSSSAKRHDDGDDKVLHFGEMGAMTYDAINDLRCIAERMISSGYLSHCIEVYGTVRKSVVDATLKRLGIGDVHLPLEVKIKDWIEAAKVCVRTLFPNEKKLCEQIFDGVDAAIAHACFMETVKVPTIQLLNFADDISLRSSPEMLFKILDMYEALVVPDFDHVFDFKSCESIRVLAAEAVSRLAEAARGTLSEFENAVLRDTSKVPVPGGTIHPLTTYVINYLISISDYKQTLNELVVAKPSISYQDVDFAEEEEGKTPLDFHLIRIVVVLQLNLDGKSRQYKDESLSHLFIMNNVHYIFDKVRGCCELKDMGRNMALLTRKF